MSFWKNPRYKQLEKSLQGGDPIRGMPQQKLPFHVTELEFSDGENDHWKISVSCIKMTPENIGQKIIIELHLEAYCRISEKNMENLGIDTSRIGLLFEGANEFYDSTTEQIKVAFEGIEKAGKLAAAKYKEKILLQFSQEIKSVAIKTHLFQLPVSRLG